MEQRLSYRSCGHGIMSYWSKAEDEIREIEDRFIIDLITVTEVMNF